jgi:hypothetical protein
VFIPFVVLAALLFAVPVVIFADGLITSGVVGLAAAIATAMVGLNIRPGEASHLTRRVRSIWVLAIVPVVIIVSQLLPFTAANLSRSIWETAGETIGRSLPASTTIDPGATVISLGHYWAFLCIGVATAAVSIEPRRAEWVLIFLTGVTASTALLLIVHDRGGFTFLGEMTSINPRSDIAAAGAFSLPLAISCAVLVVERYETQKMRGQGSLKKTAIILGITVAALLTSATALIHAAMMHALIAGICGLAASAIIIAIRRLGLERWAAIALVAITVGSAMVIAITKSPSLEADLTLRFANRASPQVISMAERMLTDAGWLGTGAGTFPGLAQIYRTTDSTDASLVSAPTTAAQVSIELGRIGFLAIVIVMVALIGFFTRGAFTRGRDSFYAMTGVACSITALIEAFADGGLTSTAISILLACVFGLSLAQNVGRSLSTSG